MANVCRHRGMPLAEGRGNSKRFICSYHAWTYDRSGALLRAPRMENTGFDPKTCKLPQHKVQLWNGFIYVSLDPNAAPFEHPDLDTMLAPYAPQEFRLIHVAEENWQTNWKCLVENFMEGYHLSVVHPETLHGYTPSGLSRKLVSGDGYTSYAANYPDNIAPRGDGAPTLSAAERQRSSLFSKFPTQVASQETIQDRIKLWEEVNREDREKLERLQIALGSDYALEGPLAQDDYEGTIRDFQLWLAQEDRKTQAL